MNGPILAAFASVAILISGCASHPEYDQGAVRDSLRREVATPEELLVWKDGYGIRGVSSRPARLIDVRGPVRLNGERLPEAIPSEAYYFDWSQDEYWQNDTDRREVETIFRKRLVFYGAEKAMVQPLRVIVSADSGGDDLRFDRRPLVCKASLTGLVRVVSHDNDGAVAQDLLLPLHSAPLSIDGCAITREHILLMLDQSLHAAFIRPCPDRRWAEDRPTAPYHLTGRQCLPG